MKIKILYDHLNKYKKRKNGIIHYLMLRKLIQKEKDKNHASFPQ